MTMTLIETKTLGTAAASIEFTSIPGTYTDLYILASHRQTQTFADVNGYPTLTLNNSTSNYSFRWIQGSGSAVASSSSTYGGFYWFGNNDFMTANTFSNTSIYIPNYAGSTNKSVSFDTVQETNATASFQQIMAGLWSDTAAITSLKLTARDSGLGTSPSFVVGTTISLYGILKGSSSVVVS